MSITDDFHEHPLPPLSIELAVENLLPRPEIELAIGNRNHNFPTHDRSFKVGVRVVFGAVVAVLAVGFLGREFLQPDLEIVVQPAFIVVDENAGSDVHRVDQAQAFTDAAFTDGLRDIIGNVQELPALRHIEPELFAKGFHGERLKQEARKPGKKTTNSSKATQSPAQIRSLLFPHSDLLMPHPHSQISPRFPTFPLSKSFLVSWFPASLNLHFATWRGGVTCGPSCSSNTT